MSADTAALGPSPAMTPPSNGLAERIRTDICYKCQKPGHWARDCPSKTPNKRSQPSSSNPSDDTDIPVIRCPGGHGPCYAQTSGTERNPNRKYYECPRKRSGGCGFFKWYDELGLPENIPLCRCDAGRCTVSKETIGPNVGRWYFTCRVPKGHGACPFFQWVDDQLNTTTNNSEVDNTMNGDLGREGNSGSGHSKRMRIESSMMDNNNLSPDLSSVPGPLTEPELPITGFNKHDQPSETLIPQVVVTKKDRPLDFIASDDSSRGAQLRLPTMYKTAHPSSPFLSEASISLRFGIGTLTGGPIETPHSPSTDSEKSSLQTSGPAAELTIAVYREPSKEEQVVRTLQNDLINHLKDSRDLEFMEGLANPILDVLDGLSADSRNFRECVREFICCASGLTKVDCSTSTESSMQDVIDKYNHEKDRLNDISRKHSEALDAFTVADKEASRLKAALIEIQNQLSCCEVETSRLKTRLDEICKDKMECKRSLQTAEEALILSQKREEELRAAKEAFEKARNQLHAYVSDVVP